MGKPDILQGSLALLVLKTLQYGPMHGWDITLHIQKISHDVLRVEEGSLYPALHRLERDKLVKAEWKTTDNRRRARVYTLTAAGRKRLGEAEESWTALAKGVGRLLRYV